MKIFDNGPIDFDTSKVVEITQEYYLHLRDSVPPINYTGRSFYVGEPTSHIDGIAQHLACVNYGGRYFALEPRTIDNREYLLIETVEDEILDDYDKYRINQEEYDEMVLPRKIFEIIDKIRRLFDITFYYCDVKFYNRGGYVYAKAPGFSYSYCTSSYENGPDADYSEEIIMMLKGLGFEIENSHGDNGMDSATNFHDTYWTYEFAYTKMKEYID